MKLTQLLEIKTETDRFQRRLRDAITLAENTPGYLGYDNKLWGKHDISGTRTCRALKRAAMDFKYDLTELL